MIHFLTYSNDLMSRSRARCVDSARRNGADIIHEYTPSDISDEFYINNDTILDTKFTESRTRPCDGFWLWKPYFINKVMNQSEDGDYVVYVDAGVELIAGLQYIIDAMTANNEDIFLFTNGLQHVHWCKADVMQAINGHQLEVHHQQVQASAMWINVTPFSRRFIKEWLLWAQMPGMIDDSPSVIPNHPEYAAHRYDQAILCCLQIKYALRTHWWADRRWFESQRYRWPEDKYPCMFDHHRMRNSEY